MLSANTGAPKLKFDKYRMTLTPWLITVALMFIGLFLSVFHVDFRVLGMAIFGMGCGILGWVLGGKNERDGACFEVNKFNQKQ